MLRPILRLGKLAIQTALWIDEERSPMLRTGKEYLECLKDGRVIFIGNERVEDVTTHPAFRNAARTVAAIYDMKADPANREVMYFTEAGDVFSMYYLRARPPEDM